MARIGVLALQGGFGAHARALSDLGHQAIEVRSDINLTGLDGLILPGGESTVQLKLIDRHGLGAALEQFATSGLPILATCAGLILAARKVTGPEQRSFAWTDITVSRNAWGRQVDSFETTTNELSVFGANSGLQSKAEEAWPPLPLVFIRAPRILQTGATVQVLATLAGEPILIRERNFFGATFHPELTSDRRIHRLAFG
jgi:5'-phosphate synthase pdxT subunit